MRTNQLGKLYTWLNAHLVFVQEAFVQIFKRFNEMKYIRPKNTKHSSIKVTPWPVGLVTLILYNSRRLIKLFGIRETQNCQLTIGLFPLPEHAKDKPRTQVRERGGERERETNLADHSCSYVRGMYRHIYAKTS